MGLAELRQRVASAEAAVESAKAAVTPEEQEERELRARLDAAESEARGIAKAKRVADLDTRLESAQAVLGPKALLRAHDAEETSPGAGTFIIRYPGADAATAFSKAIGKNASQGKHDHSEAYQAYARRAIYDWNGHTSLAIGADPAVAELSALLSDRYPLVLSIVNIVDELGGSAQRARKR